MDSKIMKFQKATNDHCVFILPEILVSLAKNFS